MQQRTVLKGLVRQRREPFRLSVDMARTDAAHRLKHAKRLAEEIGIPVVVFGAGADSPTDAAVVGFLRDELESLEVLIAFFLDALRDLQS